MERSLVISVNIFYSQDRDSSQEHLFVYTKDNV